MIFPVLTGMLLMATLIEGTVEYFFGDVIALKGYLRYISLAFGILASLAYGLDLLGFLGFATPFPIVGCITSGILIGRGSNYLNDLISSFKGDVTPIV